MLSAMSLLVGLLASQAAESGGVAAWDTGQAAAMPLTAEQVSAKAGWTAIPRDQMLTSFGGDAVVTNGRILAVARKQGAAVEGYAWTAGKGPARAPPPVQGGRGGPAARLGRPALVGGGKA